MMAKLLISTDKSHLLKKINQLLERVAIANPHPDLLYFPSDSKLGIEQAKKIREHFSFKPYSARGRAAVLEDASLLTADAQNALLKTLEELPKEAIMILSCASEAKLLPTVLSRCQITYLQPERSTLDVEHKKSTEKLLAANIEERFDFIENLGDRKEFLKGLIAYFHQNISNFTENKNPAFVKFLKELLQAEEWATQNVNIRGILEYLMMVMPRKSQESRK